MAGRATDPIPGGELREILLLIAALPSGYEAAIEVLYMRLHSNQEMREEPAPELIEVGSELMQRFPFDEPSERRDYGLGVIVKACLKGREGGPAVKRICRNLKDAISDFRAHAHGYPRLLEALLCTQPADALDELCGGDEEELASGTDILRDAMVHADVIAAVPEDELVKWCDRDAAARYPAIARVVGFAEGTPEKGKKRWTVLALRMLRNAPDPSAVLRQFVGRFMPEEAWATRAYWRTRRMHYFSTAFVSLTV